MPRLFFIFKIQSNIGIKLDQKFKKWLKVVKRVRAETDVRPNTLYDIEFRNFLYI